MDLTVKTRTHPYYTFNVHVNGLLLRVLISDPPYEDTNHFSFLPHNHSRYELHLVSAGRVYVHTETINFVANKGDVCIIHPYEYHTFLRPVDKTPARLSVLSFYFTDEISRPGSSKDANWEQVRRLLDRIYTFSDKTKRIESLFCLISEAFHDKRSGYLHYIQGLIASLMICLFQELYANHGFGTPDQMLFLNGDREWIIESFFLFGYMRRLTIKELAEQLHLCTRRVSELIKQLYGCTFSQKLVDTRIEIAKLLLLYSKQSASEISRACGFHSPNYFYTSFRKATNQPPRQYRKVSRAPFAEHIMY